tara:strand:+ start:12570 stop:13322 length:753 start_codon:yes stop_codon:yes gene_type:complete
MAKTFYYDSEGLLEATINDGTYSGTSWSDSDSMINEERLVDQSIATAATGFNNADALKITFPSSKSLDFIALYFSAAETDDISLYRAVATNTFSSAIDITANFSAGWSIKEFSSAASMNWHLASTSGDILNLTEFIIGQKLEFELNPEIGMGESESFNTSVNQSIGGVEYAVKIGNPKTVIAMNFSSISSTFKDSLQSMQESVQDYKKFIYSENGASGPHHYVRLDSPIEFKEVSYNRYSCDITLNEQLS